MARRGRKIACFSKKSQSVGPLSEREKRKKEPILFESVRHHMYQMYICIYFTLLMEEVMPYREEARILE